MKHEDVSKVVNFQVANRQSNRATHLLECIWLNAAFNQSKTCNQAFDGAENFIARFLRGIEVQRSQSGTRHALTLP